MLNLFKFISLRHLFLKPTRVLLTTLGIALGVSLFIAIEIINKSTLQSFKQSVEAISGKANLVITGPRVGFSSEILDKLKKFKEIKHAVPMVQTNIYFTNQNKLNENLVVLGVDLLKESSVRTYKTTDEEVMDDPLIFLNQPDSIIVTHEFAKRNNLGIDSKIEVATPVGIKVLTIRGLLTPEGVAKAYGGALAIMDIDGANYTFGRMGKLDRVDLILRESVDLESVKQNLSAFLGGAFEVQRPSENSKNMERLVHSYQALLSFFSTLALLVGVFLVINTVSISVVERRKEIGTLRAVGATKISIATMFMSEAFIMGLVGSFMGVFWGKLLSHQMVEMVATSMSRQYVTKISVTKIYFGLEHVLLGVVVGTLTAVFAALWPSIKASFIKPVEAMKKLDFNQLEQKSTLKIFYVGLSMLIYLVVSSYLGLGSKHKVLQYMSQGCTMIGSALVAPAIVTYLASLIKKTVKINLPLLKIALDNLIRFPKRTASNVTTLMVGLILVMMVTTLNKSFQTTLSNWFDRVFKADIVVSSSGDLVGFQTQPLAESIGLEIEEKVKGINKGVTNKGVYALRFTHFNMQGRQMGIKAFDKPDPSYDYAMLDIVDGPARGRVGEKLFNSENTIVVSEIFKAHINKTTGDIVTIETPTGSVDFKILAVVVDYASPEGIVYMSRDTYKKYWQDNLVSAYSLTVAPGFTVNQVRQDIDAQFGKSKSLMTVSQKEMKNNLLIEIDKSFSYTKAIEATALLIAFLGLFNTFMISVMERLRELGVLRAIGMEQIQLIKMILTEAFWQGSLGALTAIILGFGVSYIFIENDLSLILGWIIRFSFPWEVVGYVLLIGIFTGLVAAYVPARRAAQIKIREALEYE
ncbi:MAG: ABC transporter permease [Oligoflexia bacterium]|nr:ABC transporter permease [Oligoflexia bacterium]